MPNTWERVVVDGHEMAVYVSKPEGTGPFPAVVMPPHNGGVDWWYREMTRRMAAAGYVAACPDLYHRDPPDCTDVGNTRFERLRSDTIIKDGQAMVEFLRSNAEVDGERIGVLGYCGGGQIAYLMAGAIRDFKVACVYYPSHLPVPWADGRASMEWTSQIRCPLLGLFGEWDNNPSVEEARQIDEELTRLGTPHEFHIYPNTGHGFAAHMRQELYNATSDRDAWARVVAFFDKHLGRVAAAAL